MKEEEMNEEEKEIEDIDPEALAEDVDEVNVFKRLLYDKDKVHVVRIRTPFLNEPLLIHFMRLDAGEEPELNIPKGFTKMADRERAEVMRQWNSTIAWKMIAKANKSGKVTEKYVLDRRTWDMLKKEFSDVHDNIIGRVTGAYQELIDAFLSGPTSQ